MHTQPDRTRMSNRAVAERPGCAEGTVAPHVTALLRKAACHGRGELIVKVWSSP